MDTLDELFEEQIKDLYNAEGQLVKALPKMAKKASVESLRTAFTDHLQETQTHVKRLEKIAEELEFRPSGKTCQAMKGLLEEGKEVLEEDESLVTDAALIGAAQRVEHYEISAYGTARAMAERLGHSRIAKLLQETLDEEAAADEKLTEISENDVLPQVVSAGSNGRDD